MIVDKSAQKQLIKALQSNNISNIDKSFQKIYELFSGILFYIAFNIVQDKMEAEEIVNDTFLALFNNIDKLDWNKNIKYWLIKTTKNKSIDSIRKKRRFSLLDEVFFISFSSTSVSSNQDDLLSDIKSFLDEIEFRIIIERFIYNLRKQMNLKTGTVSSKYSRAIKKLHLFFKREEY